MSKHNFEELKQLQAIGLDDEAKERIRGRLELFVSLKPSGFSHVAHTEPSMFSWWHFLPARKTQALLLALFVVSGGSVTARAAEGALPGDVLYPFKVHVNEEVRSALYFGSASQASYEVERLSRRLKEAEQLAASGELSEEREAALVARIGGHAQSARDHISEGARENGAIAVERAEQQLVATVAAHDGVLRDVLNAKKSETGALMEVQRAVESEIAATATTSIEVARASSKSAAPVREDVVKALKEVDAEFLSLQLALDIEALSTDRTRAHVRQLSADIEASRASAFTALSNENVLAAQLYVSSARRALVEMREIFTASELIEGLIATSTAHAATTSDITIE